MLVRGVFLAAVAVVVAAGFVYAAVHAGQAAPSGLCNNEIGECLRGRQELAIWGVALLSGLAAVACAFPAWPAVTRNPPGRAHVVVLVALALLLVAVLAVDPASHLNNRYEGWWSD